MFIKKLACIFLNSYQYAKDLWFCEAFVKLLRNSGIVVQAGVSTAGHKHSCPHCTSCICFSRDVGARSIAGAVWWYARPWVLDIEHLQEAPSLKMLLLPCDRAGGMTVTLFWICLFASIMAPNHTTLWVVILCFFIFNFCILQRGGNFGSVNSLHAISYPPPFPQFHYWVTPVTCSYSECCFHGIYNYFGMLVVANRVAAA